MSKRINKKELVLLELLEICEKNKNYVFDNDLVDVISKKHDFKNKFDVTKLDDKNKIPDILKNKNLTIIHLGDGFHRFINGIDFVFHSFEPIQNTINWSYKKSLLNLLNASEANILSIANNQRILHEFAFGVDKEYINADIEYRPKTYFPHRTNADNTSFYINGEEIETTNLQMEIDLTIEYQGNVVIFEAKNTDNDNFNVLQIFHPFFYYHNKNKTSQIAGKINNIKCVYMKRVVENDIVNIKLWAYTFEKPNEVTSLKFLKSTNYKLIKGI